MKGLQPDDGRAYLFGSMWRRTIGLMAVAVALPAIAGPARGQNSVVMPGASTPLLAPPAPVVSAPQLPNSPSKLDTFGDRASRCAHFGALQGLAGERRDAYVRFCANN